MKQYVVKVFALLLCIIVFFPQGMVMAFDENVDVVFVGNTTLQNEQIATYPELVGSYLQSRMEDKKINVISAEPISIDSEDFLKNLESQVISKNPDIVFFELDISKKAKGTDEEIVAKLDAVVRKLIDKETVPAIYFIYMPEENMLDYRKPYDEIAEYYGIKVCDAFSVFKNKYISGIMKTSDFLTAGLIPSEAGHGHLADIIINDLKGIKDVMEKPYTDKKPISNVMISENTDDVDEIKEESVAKESNVLYVSVDKGSDSASGQFEFPLKTLEAAAERIRILKKKQGEAFKGATVYLRGGLYIIDGSFALDEDDSGTENAPVVYTAYPGETVRFTNGELLKGERFEEVTDPSVKARINESAKGKVLQYDLKKERINPGSFMTGGLTTYSASRNYGLGNLLVSDGIGQQRAAYPDGGFSLVSEKQGSSNKQIFFDETNSERWLTADNAWIQGTLGEGYFSDTNKVLSIDTKNKFIELYKGSHYGVKPGWKWRIVNLLEEVSIPGEWYVDEITGLLYYYPRTDINSSQIIFASETDPVILLENTKNITISNITVEGSCGPGIKIIDGKSNKVENCTLRNLGYCGVYILCNDIAGPGNNGVVNCHIYNTAMMGIYIKGGDREGLTAQNDYVENCHIENYATQMHSETGGVVTDGTVGVSIRNCNIHNDNSPAIYMGGNDDLIEHNEIYNVARDTDDYGALYGDHRGAVRQGITYAYNYMHDVRYLSDVGTTGFVGGVYTDANRNNGAKVLNNVFAGVENPIFFSSNQNMLASENLFLDTTGRAAIRMWNSPYNGTTLDNYNTELDKRVADGTFFEAKGFGEKDVRAVNPLIYRAYLESPEFNEETEKTYFLKYPWLEHYLESRPLEARNITVKNNALFNAEGDLDLPNESVNMLTVNNYITKHSVTAEQVGSDDIHARIAYAMKTAKEKIGEFEIWDIKNTGVQTGSTPIGDFQIVYPAADGKEIDVNKLVLRWDWAAGADEYKVLVATDAEFKNIVFSEITRDNFSAVSGLQNGGKKYYWKVIANSFSDKFTGTPENAGGTHIFYSAANDMPSKELLEGEILSAESFGETVVEGELAGQYPQGAIKELADAINDAKAIYNSSRASQAVVDKTAEIMKINKNKVFSKMNLQEVNLADYFKKVEDVLFMPRDIKGPINGAESVNLKQLEDGIEFSGRGGMFANGIMPNYNVYRFRAKFDFEGQGSRYTMFGISSQTMSPVLYDTQCYVFLVMKDSIELQGFKTSGVGKFYMTIPNTFIEEGKEYDIDFCAVPAMDGTGMRIVLRVDGEVVYDYIDKENTLSAGGYAGVMSSRDECTFTISQPTENPDYPRLIDELQNPESMLNKKSNEE